VLIICCNPQTHFTWYPICLRECVRACMHVCTQVYIPPIFVLSFSRFVAVSHSHSLALSMARYPSAGPVLVSRGSETLSSLSHRYGSSPLSIRKVCCSVCSACVAACVVVHCRESQRFCPPSRTAMVCRTRPYERCIAACVTVCVTGCDTVCVVVHCRVVPEILSCLSHRYSASH